jgi:pRiA4b ORF-3-like protein
VSNTKRSRDELTELRTALAAQGAPDEILQVIDQAHDIEDALRRLDEAGMTPTPESILEGLLDGFSPLLERGCDALEAELAGADFLGVLRTGVSDDDLPAMLTHLARDAAVSGAPEALAMLRVLAVTGPTEVQTAATEAADGMVVAGLKDRPWVKDLSSLKVGACFGYAADTQAAIALTFTYGRKSHAVVTLIDYALGGGVKDCFVTDRPDRVRAEYKSATKRFALTFRDYTPAEARAILDEALVNEPCPVEPDQVEDVHTFLDLLRRRTALLSGTTKSPTSAVYRIKITLRGSKPPIWRRLEVPSGTTLHRLHGLIQDAFGWQDYHMWVFETAQGDYGVADPELGHRSAASKKLSDVAPRAGDRITYTYDFGDNWEHQILVEDVLTAEPGVKYPRAVAGRRAGPPEDCGGIWGYQELCETLANPEHEEHASMVEWLGLDSAADFDPAAFDLDAVNKALGSGSR